MQKLTVMVCERDRTVALNNLRKLGLVHIKHMRKPQADYITSIQNRILLLDKALAILKDTKDKRQKVGEKDINLCLKEVVFLDEEKQKLKEKISESEKYLQWFKDWGKVSAHSLEELKKSKVFVKLYECDARALKRIPKNKLIYVVGKKEGRARIVFLSKQKDDSLGFKEVKAPEVNPHTQEEKIQACLNRIKEIDKNLEQLSSYKEKMREHKNDLLKKLEFCQVRFGMDDTLGISLLQGYCPRESVPQIAKTAKEFGWGLISEEPAEGDQVPTFIRNPKWVEIIRPVFKFMGTLPGYREYDISFWFLLFFSVFFAMLISDGGYGLIFLVATFFIHKKFKGPNRQFFFLMYVLSASTILWGAITGTWFGFEKIAHLPLLNLLVVDKINSFTDTNQLFMIHLCFLIGAIHLTIAHGIIAFRFINSLRALGQVGWILVIWCVFFIAGKLVLDRGLPHFTVILGILGLILITLFSNPQKNILKSILVSLANLPLKAISSFSDVVSYMRLFAVGYATVIMATTFNNMAASFGFNNVFSGFFSALIIFFGHTLNIALGLMAVIVHGIRLNMLEFSGHLNMEWSGTEYRPFKE